MSTPEVVREAQTAETYNPLAKTEGRSQTVAHSGIKVEQGEVLKNSDWIRVKLPWPPTTRFYDQQILREMNSRRQRPHALTDAPTEFIACAGRSW